MIFALAALVLSSAQAGTFSTESVYGTDTRKDIYEVKDPGLLKAADASVALFKFWDLSEGSHHTDISGKKLRKSQNLCEGEKFADQLTSAYCSGTLIAKDLVLTAGHCVKHELFCAGIRVVFGYELDSAGADPSRVDSSQVYSCSRVVALYNESNGRDFAVIELDRAVGDHVPAELRRGADRPAVGTPLFTVGYPSGLPKKVATGATLRKLERGKFVSNLDTFVNNSGSPVFNATTGLVEGVLIGGDDDYVLDKKLQCNRVKVSPIDGGLGETATDIGEVTKELGW
jgi:V8-like Glu-specific endopeptidase